MDKRPWKAWTDEEDRRLKEYLNSGKYTMEEIGALFNGRSKGSIHGRLQVLGIHNDRYQYHLYDHDTTFFHVPNLLNSYWAGVLAADGCIVDHNVIQLALSSKDKEFLSLFKQNTKYTGPINNTIASHRSATGKCYYVSIIRISGASECIRDLESNFSVVRNKTFRLAPPKLDSLLLKFAYIRGFTDGDGTVCFGKTGVCIRYTSCSQAILQWIKDTIDNLNFKTIFPSKSQVNSINNGRAFDLAFGATRGLKLFLLLNSLDTPFLARKWRQQPIFDYIASQRLKYPGLFDDIDSLIAKLRAEQSSSLAPLISSVA